MTEILLHRPAKARASTGRNGVARHGTPESFHTQVLQQTKEGLQTRIRAFLLKKTSLLFAPLERLGHDGNAEAIHQTRVASRRLRVALRFFGNLFSRGELKPILRRLRQIRGALGEIRTLDVNVNLLRRATKQLPAETEAVRGALEHDLLQERAGRVKALRELAAKLDMDKLELPLCRLITTAAGKASAQLLLQDANEQVKRYRRSLRRRYKQYLKKGGNSAFHKFRLAAKRYRYVLEACAEVFGAAVNKRIRGVEVAQELMGDVHDLEVLREYLKEKMEESEEAHEEGIGRIAAYFEKEQKKRQEKFDCFLEEAKLKMKKVELKIGDE